MLCGIYDGRVGRSISTSTLSRETLHRTQNLLGDDPTSLLIPAYTFGYAGSSYLFEAAVTAGSSAQSSSAFVEVGEATAATDRIHRLLGILCGRVHDVVLRILPHRVRRRRFVRSSPMYTSWSYIMTNIHAITRFICTILNNTHPVMRGGLNPHPCSISRYGGR